MDGHTDGSSKAYEHIRERALFIRRETVRLISIAKTGHYASTFSCAEILASLYYGVMRLRAGEPDWPDRDRLLLGKGHAAVGVYPVLADWGFLEASTLEEYTRLGNPLGDHPDMRRVPGIDFSSGSLGHALSAGLGMCLAARIQGLDFNVFVLLGDGELHEGQVWEAALAASHHGVGRLIAIVDRNRFSLDGEVEEIVGIEPLLEKWRAFGWRVHEVNGHDVTELVPLLQGLAGDRSDPAPAVVVAHTVKGMGVEFMESEPGWHLGWLDETDEREVLGELQRRYAAGGLAGRSTDG
jgi:transketolase